MDIPMNNNEDKDPYEVIEKTINVFKDLNSLGWLNVMTYFHKITYK